MIKQKKLNNIIKLLFLFFFISTLMSVVFAEGPSTVPCWVKGTVTGDGITVAGLVVEAYDGTNLLKSGTISDGEYSLNSVGSIDGTTITLKVYGAPFDTFTFVGFCDTNGDPWVVEDFNVSTVENGVTCSNNAICTSGYCSGTVCANAPSGGSSTHTGSSSGTTGIDTNTEVDTNTTVGALITGAEREMILSQADIDGLFGEGTIEDDLVVTYLYSETNVLTIDETNNLIENLDSVTIDLINSLITSNSTNNVQVTTHLQSYEITDASGVTKIVSRITITVTALDDIGQVTYIEEIPKSIAADVAELVFNIQPTQILNADPIVLFTFNNLVRGETKEISYVVNKNVSTLQNNNYFAAGALLVVTTPDTTTPNVDSTIPTNVLETKNTTWIWVVLIIAVILLVFGYVLFLNRRKKNKL